MQRVKIVGTLGPSSATAPIVSKLIEAGLDVARLNFSHGSHEQHREVFNTIRRVAEKQGQYIAVMADLSGPKIRLGKVRDGCVSIRAGSNIVITTEQLMGDERRVSTSYSQLPDDVGAGSRILIDDGLIELKVELVEEGNVHCRVVVGGELKDHKGMNIPGAPLSTPAITEKDERDIEFAKSLGVDYFALSFVRRPEDVTLAKKLAGDIPVIAKIEKPEAVERIDEIIAVADGIMVARGDLGIEAGAERVPLIQKRIIRKCADAGIPVIVATQMLDSMIHNPRPTRAEVSDVANAVLDGTDAVMLSGETASGKYPVRAVAEMAAILEEVEGSEVFHHLPEPARLKERSFSNAIARAAVEASRDLKLKALAVYTETGHSVALVSACRPLSTIVAFSRHERVLRQAALRWGVIPFYADWVEGIRGVVEQAERILTENNIASFGDDIAITFGMRDITGPGRTDVLKLWRIQKND